MSSNYLTDLAEKLNITDPKILRKAKEIINLLDNRPPLQCSESCKIVVCLELASSALSGAVNRENAIKYSGCKRSIYVNMLNIISKIVNLDKVYTVKELCLSLGMSEIQSTAQKLIDNRKKSGQLHENDLEHPMLPCAAVLAACRSESCPVSDNKANLTNSDWENLKTSDNEKKLMRTHDRGSQLCVLLLSGILTTRIESLCKGRNRLHKIKVNMKMLVEISRIKRTELESLSMEFEKLAGPLTPSKSKKRVLQSAVPNNRVGANWSVEKEPKIVSEDEKEDGYMKWKKRMLAGET